MTRAGIFPADPVKKILRYRLREMTYEQIYFTLPGPGLFENLSHRFPRVTG